MSLHAASEPSQGHALSTLFDLEDQAEELLLAEAYEDAISAAEAALAIDPKSLTAQLVCARALKARGRLTEAACALENILVHMPGLATVCADIAAIYVDLERYDEARDHLIRATEMDPSFAQAFANLGSVYMRIGRWDLAEPPTRHALLLDADNLIANLNIAAIDANRHGLRASAPGDNFHRGQTFLVEKAYQPVAPIVLILSSAGAGNVPYQHLFPRTKFSRILWFLEGALPEHESEIPAHDMVFNAVGDPDAAPEAHALAREFVKNCKRPVINLPDRVDATTRAGVAGLLEACEDTLIPKVKRMERHAGDPALDAYDPRLRYPLIARPAGRHGGEGAVLIDGPDHFASHVPDAPVIYATEFVDYRSPDGWYRKYRVIFIDRKPYPYHMVIGANWLLHHWTAGMENDAQRRAEELRFLTGPEAMLGEKAWRALERVGVALDLDFAGIDFSVLGDGRLLLFEANATMLVHPEDDQLFAYKNFAVENILHAFDRMMAEKLGGK
ncbi:MAG TPA: tetratricopeptide repeat protein [Rhizomicrobium sp.]|nr:tetratricopeptide repeat protein [Rhizomicrobium sp.]